MRLTRIRISGYKHLKEVELNAENTNPGNLPVYFCAGLNGTGKSAFLEAVALIFSRISQNELPGFGFEISYELFLEGKTVAVTVHPEEERELGRLHIVAGEEVFHSFEGNEKYLPHKVFACISGQNSQMNQLLSEGARDSIISDIYDAGRENLQEQIGQLVRYLTELRENPRVLFLDEEMAGLILFVLCAWKPRKENGYTGMRAKLLQKLSNGFIPAVLSITAEREKIETPLFSELLYHRKEAEEQRNKRLATWMSEDEGQVTAAYCMTGEKENFCAEGISERYMNPLPLLIALLQAKNSGEMKECHILFQRKAGEDFLTERALSDGELMWLGRMGLVLLARQAESDNCLFLFDEPDVHLNESWNVDFTANLQELIRAPEGIMHHNFLVTTHSSLLLTDAPPNQIFLFGRKGRELRIRQIPISLFAASRSEISQNMFETRAEIGAYADQQVEEILEKEEDPRRLYDYISKMGPGIRRYQLLDKYLNITGEWDGCI